MDLSRRQTLGASLSLLTMLSFDGVERMSTTREEPPESRVVTSTDELEAAFNNLRKGDTVIISAAGAPYRTTQWLDVDADGVTVRGPGLQSLIKPADGANVGGIRIGHDSSCRNVRIRGVGFHGNRTNQQSHAKRLHGIVVRNASNVTLEGNILSHLHPFREHGSGGSGISAERESKNVRILNNRIYEFGDRGIQLGGKNVVVSGNIVTDGIDRGVACDLWAPDGRNEVADWVVVSENLVGNCREGSLMGVATGRENVGSRISHLIIANNVGFGYHKNFCHVRGPTKITNVTIRGNVSTQSTDGLWTNKTTKFAGIAADPAGATGVTISDNALVGYSRHGVHVKGSVSDLKIANNTVLDPAAVGIRVQGATNGTVTDNTVARTGDHGILLRNTDSILASGNHLRKLALGGVVLHSSGETNHSIESNHIDSPNNSGDDAIASIHVDTSRTFVQGNVVVSGGDAPAISDSKSARRNVYQNNVAGDDAEWAISDPSSVVNDNVPSFDAHPDREVTADGEVRIEFEKPYGEPPVLQFGRRGGGVEDVEYLERSGKFVGAVVDVDGSEGLLDVSVDSFR